MKYFTVISTVCVLILFGLNSFVMAVSNDGPIVSEKNKLDKMQLIQDKKSGQLRLVNRSEQQQVQALLPVSTPKVIQNDDSSLSMALTMHPLPATAAYVNSYGEVKIYYGSVPVEVLTLPDNMAAQEGLIEASLKGPEIQACISDDEDEPTSSSTVNNGEQLANIVICSSDFQGDENQSGEGFYDPTPVEAVGGNMATTLGEQRQNVFLEAARIWGKELLSDVTIYVNASFTPLTCSENSGVLGSAEPNYIHSNFDNAPQADTWYVGALANSLSGQILAKNADIDARFNSNIDYNDDCLNGINWYLGLDGKNNKDMDLLTVVLHEMAHGLGFISLVDVADGSLRLGEVNGEEVRYHDIWDHYLYGVRLGTWLNLTDEQRAYSATRDNNLVWQGENVTLHASAYSEGVHELGLFKMYAPNSVELGSSVSHFDKSVTPNTLMEPEFTEHTTDVGLAGALLEDIGWLRPAASTLAQ